MKHHRIRRMGLGLILLAALAAVLLIKLVTQEETTQTFSRLPEQTLILDPGHGGEDGGAVSVSGQKESDLNLAIALRLDQLMGFCGVDTILTRDTDRSMHDPEADTIREKKVSDLHNRTAQINAVENATLISIHQNSYPDQRCHGTQIFYAGESLSRPFAQTVQTCVQTALDQENHRKVKPVPASVYLMNHISCRAILVECGFLSNPEEDRLLQTAAYQQKLALVLAASYIQSGDTQEGESLI